MKNIYLTLSIIAIAVIWGTSFLGIRFAVETIPPLYVAGIRHVLSAFILFVFLMFQGGIRWIGWEKLKVQLILSTCILILTNGLVTIAEKFVSSSLASLISACSPILVFIGSVALNMQKFTLKSMLGILLGFTGIIFIFWDGIADFANPDYTRGILYLFLGISANAAGALYIKKTGYTNDNMLLNLFYQFTFAGIIQIGTAVFLGEEFHPSSWSLSSIIALLFLTIFASIIAYLSYIYALTKVSAVKVSLLSYINTIIAIFLGWLVADEKVDSKFIIATALIIIGIFITNYKPGMFRAKKKL